MENASLAVRMAGGVLIALLIVGFFVSVMVIINENQQKKQDEEDLRQVELFNESYKSYENRIITGYQLLSLINKAIDYNTRMTKESKYKNEDFSFVPIHIYGKVIGTDAGGSKMFPNQGNATKYQSPKTKDGVHYIDLNEYYTEAYVKASKDTQNEFKNMYFKWDDTKHVSPEETDAKGNKLGDVDGVGKVYEMYFTEYANN